MTYLRVDIRDALTFPGVMALIDIVASKVFLAHDDGCAAIFTSCSDEGLLDTLGLVLDAWDGQFNGSTYGWLWAFVASRSQCTPPPCLVQRWRQPDSVKSMQAYFDVGSVLGRQDFRVDTSLLGNLFSKHFNNYKAGQASP